MTQPIQPGDERWIAIADTPSDPQSLPWNGQPVLIYTDHKFYGRIHRAIWTDQVHGHDIYGWAVEDCKHGPYALRGYMKVTHWMPLPEPPALGDILSPEKP